MSKEKGFSSLSISSTASDFNALTKSLNDSFVLMLNFIKNSSLYDLINELNELKIQEKTLIGIVLGLITVILWCLVKCKKKRLSKQHSLNKLQHEQGQMENYEGAKTHGSKNKQRYNSGFNGNTSINTKSKFLQIFSHKNKLFAIFYLYINNIPDDPVTKCVVFG